MYSLNGVKIDFNAIIHMGWINGGVVKQHVWDWMQLTKRGLKQYTRWHCYYKHGVNARDVPSPSGKIVKIMKRGQVVVELERQGKWIKVLEETAIQIAVKKQGKQTGTSLWNDPAFLNQLALTKAVWMLTVVPGHQLLIPSQLLATGNYNLQPLEGKAPVQKAPVANEGMSSLDFHQSVSRQKALDDMPHKAVGGKERWPELAKWNKKDRLTNFRSIGKLKKGLMQAKREAADMDFVQRTSPQVLGKVAGAEAVAQGGSYTAAWRAAKAEALKAGASTEEAAGIAGMIAPESNGNDQLIDEVINTSEFNRNDQLIDF